MRKKQLGILAAVVATMVCTALPVSAATPFGEYVFPESGLTIAQALRNADGSFPQMGAASPDAKFTALALEDCIVVTCKAPSLEKDVIVGIMPNSPYTPEIDFSNETQLNAVAVLMLSAQFPKQELPDDFTYTITFPASKE